MLMQVMHFDPMLECVDVVVERGFQMTILGLGDIIIPGMSYFSFGFILFYVAYIIYFLRLPGQSLLYNEWL